MIKLNVGGTKFQTARAVLERSSENYFTKLFKGQIPVLRGAYLFLIRTYA